MRAASRADRAGESEREQRERRRLRHAEGGSESLPDDGLRGGRRMDRSQKM